MKNTVRKIRLEGELGEKFGEIWYLNVSTPAEAIRAIDTQRKGFRQHFLDTHNVGVGYDIIIGDQGIKQVEEIGFPAPIRDDFTFIPIPAGSKQERSGGFYFAVGLVLFAASGGFSGLANLGATGGFEAGLATAWGGGSYFFAMAGAALMAGGVSMMLAPSITEDDTNEEQSYLFDGPVNTAKQGVPVPILYGRMIVGGATVSASVSSDATAGFGINVARTVAGPHDPKKDPVDPTNPGTPVVGGCFIKGTLVQMADGTEKEISLIELNDYTRGGRVESLMQFLPSIIYDYKGVKVSSTHWVKEEGQFIKIENSKYGILTDQIAPVYCLVTSEHRIFINDIEFTDYTVIGSWKEAGIEDVVLAIINKESNNEIRI
jgi:predicted phage tail protein